MKKILALILALVMVLCVFAGCAKTETPTDKPAEKTEEVVLELWLAGQSVGDTSLPEEEWWITERIAAFEATNPGIKVELTVPAGQVEVTQTYKSAFSAGTEPDIVNLWSGSNLFPLKDLFLDMSEYVPAEDYENITVWHENYLDFDTENGKLLAIPYTEAGLGCTFFYYNKTIFTEVGIDVATMNTIEGFEAAMQKLEDAGYQPLTCDDEGYGVLYSVVGLAWANAVDGAGIYANSIGTTKFADDEVFIKTLELSQKWYNEGWLNQDYATCTSSLSNFMTGKAAMFAAGAWYAVDATSALGVDNVGVVQMPSFEGAAHDYTLLGGSGQCLAVSANCEHPEEAMKFISFLNSKESTDLALKQLENLPVRPDVDYPQTGAFFDEMVAIAAKPCFYYDNTMRADVVTEFYRIYPQVVSGSMTIDEALTILDNQAATGD